MSRTNNRSYRFSALSLLAVAALLALAACSEEAVPCEGEPMIHAFTANMTTVAAGGTLDLTIEVHNFNLGTHTHSDMHEPVPVSEDDPGVIFSENTCLTGHVHIYLDDLMTNPILMQEMATGTATIPAGTAAGTHTLIARLHTSDHLIVEPQVTKELTIEVQ